MNRALGEVPITIKLRTGVKDGRNTAHKLMPRIASEWGVGCMTVSDICHLDTQILCEKGHKHISRPNSTLTIDGGLALTLLPFPTGSVARAHATAEVPETCRLGLHQRVCRRCADEGS